MTQKIDTPAWTKKTRLSDMEKVKAANMINKNGKMTCLET